jgi:hypothetical protein
MRTTIGAPDTMAPIRISNVVVMPMYFVFRRLVIA